VVSFFLSLIFRDDDGRRERRREERKQDRW